jgi:hypothetical protein
MPGVAAPRDEPRWLRPLRLALILYFALRLGFLAFALDASVPPDESTHLGRILAYSQAFPHPEDTPATHAFGPIAGQPYLYHLALGALTRINVLPVPDLLFLRMLNALLGLATVITAMRWIELLTRDGRTGLFFLVLVTNTLMFTGISAAVSYDNGANLLATLGLLFLFRFSRDHRTRDLLALAVATLAGCLTKAALLPLAGIYAAVLLLREGRQLRRMISLLRPASRPEIAMASVAGLLLAANLALYGGNALRYGRLQPTLAQIAGPEAAMHNRTAARDTILRAYRTGEIDYERAVDMSQDIRSPADRRSTRQLLRISQRVGDDRLGLPAYSWVWSRLMLQRSFGYFGHRVLRRPPVELAAYAAFGIAALALAASSWRRRRRASEADWAGLIAAGYLLAVMLAVNRPSYLSTGLVDLAVQGRYAFPILAAGAGFVACSFERAPSALRWVLTSACALFFLYGDLPTLLLRTASPWWGTP